MITSGSLARNLEATIVCLASSKLDANDAKTRYFDGVALST